MVRPGTRDERHRLSETQLQGAGIRQGHPDIVRIVEQGHLVRGRASAPIVDHHRRDDGLVHPGICVSRVRGCGIHHAVVVEIPGVAHGVHRIGHHGCEFDRRPRGTVQQGHVRYGTLHRLHGERHGADGPPPAVDTAHTHAHNVLSWHQAVEIILPQHQVRRAGNHVHRHPIPHTRVVCPDEVFRRHNRLDGGIHHRRHHDGEGLLLGLAPTAIGVLHPRVHLVESRRQPLRQEGARNIHHHAGRGHRQGHPLPRSGIRVEKGLGRHDVRCARIRLRGLNHREELSADGSPSAFGRPAPNEERMYPGGQGPEIQTVLRGHRGARRHRQGHTHSRPGIGVEKCLEGHDVGGGLSRSEIRDDEQLVSSRTPPTLVIPEAERHHMEPGVETRDVELDELVHVLTGCNGQGRRQPRSGIGADEPLGGDQRRCALSENGTGQQDGSRKQEPHQQPLLNRGEPHADAELVAALRGHVDLKRPAHGHGRHGQIEAGHHWTARRVRQVAIKGRDGPAANADVRAGRPRTNRR